mmetsp:Transcript_9285/g.11448  ORF Transcript_9285/g.11448 Transcript_9285/m.11448 type:complete len:85 (+) Transcript_9285:448-702(+)
MVGCWDDSVALISDRNSEDALGPDDASEIKRRSQSLAPILEISQGVHNVEERENELLDIVAREGIALGSVVLTVDLRVSNAREP